MQTTPWASPSRTELCELQAYGVVWKAVDKKNGNLVALKKIFDAFQNATDAQVHSPAGGSIPCSFTALATSDVGFSYLQRTFREIMFLQDLNNHENIIR